MSVNLEQTAMLSWNQPVVAEPVVAEPVKEEFVLPEYMQTSAPAPVVIAEPLILDPIVEPLTAPPVISEPVVNEVIVETPQVEPVIFDPNDLKLIIVDTPNPVDISNVVIPLAGMKPIGDITQEDLNDISCSPEQTQERLASCKKCSYFKIEKMITKCSACDCSISMVTTFKYKACPAGNW